jgi:hypothetical protein
MASVLAIELPSRLPWGAYTPTQPPSRATLGKAWDLVDMSARSRMRDEDDVMQYYRRFLTIGNPLHLAKHISDEDYSAEFFPRVSP